MCFELVASQHLSNQCSENLLLLSCKATVKAQILLKVMKWEEAAFLIPESPGQISALSLQRDNQDFSHMLREDLREKFQTLGFHNNKGSINQNCLDYRQNDGAFFFLKTKVLDMLVLYMGSYSFHSWIIILKTHKLNTYLLRQKNSYRILSLSLCHFLW